MSHSKQAKPFTKEEEAKIEKDLNMANKLLIVDEYQRNFGVSKECATEIADVGIKVYYTAKSELTVESLKKISDSIEKVTLKALKEATKLKNSLVNYISDTMKNPFYNQGNERYQAHNNKSRTSGRDALFNITLAKALANANYQHKEPPSTNILEPANADNNKGPKK